jgi:hypothetical protein
MGVGLIVICVGLVYGWQQALPDCIMSKVLRLAALRFEVTRYTQ